MTLSANAIILATPDILLLDRLTMFRTYSLLLSSPTQLTYGLNRGQVVVEAKLNTAKQVSIILRDSGTGAGALLTPTIVSTLTVLMKKGGLTTYSAISPTLVAVGTSGLLTLALTAGHLDTLGVAAINVTGPGIIPNDDLFIDVIAIDKNDAVRAGLSALPNVAAAAPGGLPTVGSTIPNAIAGTSAGLALKQDVDSGVTAVNAHADTNLSTINAHSDTNVTAINAHADTNLSTINAHSDTNVTTINAHADTNLSTINANSDTNAAAINAHTDSVFSGGFPSAASIRDAVLNALLQDHAVPGSVADGVAIAAGLLQGNFFMDTVASDGNGQTSARLRLWRDEGGASAATGGGSGEGEFATFQVTTTYTAPGKVATHRVVKVTS